eukprot:403368364
MGASTTCSFCCAYSSLIGFFFYGILAYMAYNRNEVFLEHKANGISEVEAKATQDLMIELSYTFLGVFVATFVLGKILEKRENKVVGGDDEYYRIHGDADIFGNVDQKLQEKLQ